MCQGSTQVHSANDEAAGHQEPVCIDRDGPAQVHMTAQMRMSFMGLLLMVQR